jgi:hypothetical protein
VIPRGTVEATIGKTFADKLDEIVFHVSQELTFTRREMVEELGCANFLAAYRLAKVLKRLNIFTAGKLFRTNPIDLARCRGIGETSIFVAMCILDYKEYNVPQWWGWKETNILKFNAFKQKAIKRARKRRHEV